MSAKSFVSPRNAGMIYVWVALIGVFALLAGSDFFNANTAKAIVNQYSVTGLVALSLVIPLAAGFFDLSIGYTMALCGIVAAHLLETTSWSGPTCAIATMLVAAAVGLLNAGLVLGLGIDSFIGTLASGAMLAAAATAISGGLTITGRIGGDFSRLAVGEIGGLQYPVLYLLGAMLVMGYLLEMTKTGRKLYALGFDREAARLNGVSIIRLGTLGFVCSSMLAGFAGMVLAARVSTADPTSGPSYLIPAFSAAFLGATQLRAGRFNPWGTVVAVLLLGTANVGLLISGGPLWTPRLFEGAVLVAAVGLTAFRSSELASVYAAMRATRRSRRALLGTEHDRPTPEHQTEGTVLTDHLKRRP
jgi:ribose transport system permease protein